MARSDSVRGLARGRAEPERAPRPCRRVAASPAPRRRSATPPQRPSGSRLPGAPAAARRVGQPLRRPQPRPRGSLPHTHERAVPSPQRNHSRPPGLPRLPTQQTGGNPSGVPARALRPVARALRPRRSTSPAARVVLLRTRGGRVSRTLRRLCAGPPTRARATSRASSPGTTGHTPRRRRRAMFQRAAEADEDEGWALSYS